jgi:hypothetical protein
MLVFGPAIVAFVNSSCGGHDDQLMERFAVAAMSELGLYSKKVSMLVHVRYI